VAEPLPYPDPPLAGVGFVLRPFVAEDVPTDRDAVDHHTSARWLNAHPDGDPAEVVRDVEGEREGGRMLILTIAAANDDRYLGAVVLLTREDAVGELAYVVAPEARGRGLALRAVQLLGDWAFAELGLGRMQLRIDPANDASHAVARRAGYEREGLLRSAYVVRGRRTDVVMYSRLPSDPPAVP
jgi:RimJ/RimL family protein N-acetyltransferase